MRAGLSTIQQTLTTEAATILNNSISEARRRNHSQTTPLHVAATLLSSPTGFLRQACVKSQPNSSHPLQCRALELCFSVALERLPSSTPVGGRASASPPISNALIAALKRAQAHQRRGCPEQQQQPLLAVKVELEQLVVSILDDPSVSRVMREASFSSPAVKATIEQSMSSATSNPNSAGLAHLVVRQTSTPLPKLSLYVNPQRHQPQEDEEEEVRKIVEILIRTKKRNPVLVGDSDPSNLIKNVFERIRTTGIAGSDARVLSLAKDFATNDPSSLPKKIQQLFHSIDNSHQKVLLDIGDLKWLVETPSPTAASEYSQIHHQHQHPATEIGKAAVVEMGKLLRNFNGKVWAIGIASCATYLRCQVYHPTMESDWELQAVPIAPRPSSLLPSLFPRQLVAPGNGIISSSVESLSAIPTPFLSRYNRTQRKNTDPDLHEKKSKSMCHFCRENYDKELAKLDDSSFNSKQPLPLWLQAAKLTTNQIQVEDQKREELLSKWNETCIHLHSDSNMLLAKIPTTNSRNDPPVRTELVLGQSTGTNLGLRNHREGMEEDSIECGLDTLSDRRNPKNATGDDRNLDTNLFKRLFKGLTEAVGWQKEAASSVALSMIHCRSGNDGSRTDVWLLFVGEDRVGKKKMAASLSELMFGTTPLVVSLGTSIACLNDNCEDGGSNVRVRGKTVIDRVAEAVRRNPFSVVVLEDIDQATTIVQGSMKQAIQSGRLLDTHGREVSLATSIFILTAKSLAGDHDDMNLHSSDEDRVEATLKCGGQLELLVRDWGDDTVGGKRRLEWKCESEENRRMKLRKDNNSKVGGVSLDLNLAVGVVEEDDNGEGSRNSSDVTVEQDQDQGRLETRHSGALTGLPSEFIDIVNDLIVFKAVDFGPLRRKVSDAVAGKFSSIVGSCGGGTTLEVDREALDRMVGGIWFGNGAAVDGFDEWMNKVLDSSFRQLKSRQYNIGTGGFVRLVLTNDRVKQLQSPPTSGGLPSTVTISVVDGYDDMY